MQSSPRDKTSKYHAIDELREEYWSKLYRKDRKLKPI